MKSCGPRSNIDCAIPTDWGCLPTCAARAFGETCMGNERLRNRIRNAQRFVKCLHWRGSWGPTPQTSRLHSPRSHQTRLKETHGKGRCYVFTHFTTKLQTEMSSHKSPRYSLHRKEENLKRLPTKKADINRYPEDKHTPWGKRRMFWKALSAKLQ